ESADGSSDVMGTTEIQTPVIANRTAPYDAGPHSHRDSVLRSCHTPCLRTATSLPAASVPLEAPDHFRAAGQRMWPCPAGSRSPSHAPEHVQLGALADLPRYVPAVRVSAPQTAVWRPVQRCAAWAVPPGVRWTIRRETPFPAARRAREGTRWRYDRGQRPVAVP